VTMRSPEIILALAVVGLLSYTACTAEKTETRTQESKVMQTSPKLVDGVFATDDHLQPVYFELNKSKLSDSAMEVVKANAEWLNTQPPYLIRLVGVADLRGSLKKNQRLAERRANALLEAYAALGIPKERLSIVTSGAEEPTCQPVTEDCLAKSRRTETWMEDKSLASR
jgi:outer membrane protein OmpA-like peptidoglycan-associated protein